MAKMQQQTQQEMAKMHETLQILSQVVQDSIHNSSGGGSHGIHDQSMSLSLDEIPKATSINSNFFSVPHVMHN